MCSSDLFRVGGREFFTDVSGDATFGYDARFCDIVPDSRIVYTYETYADSKLFAVSVATVELIASDGGTRLIWTEQGVWLDGYYGAEAGALRKAATDDMLDGLGLCLRRHPAG